MGVHFRKALLAVAVTLCLGVIATAAYAQDEEPTPPTPEAFFAAKAAAGGVLDAELQGQASLLARELLITRVQHQIEQWAVDHDGEYPQHINQLLLGDSPRVKPGFYPNPYTAQSADELNAMEVPFGWSDIAPGNFSYVQMYDATGRVTGYTIMLYGPTRESGHDIDNDGKADGVIMEMATSSTPFMKGMVSYLSGGKTVKIYQGE